MVYESGSKLEILNVRVNLLDEPALRAALLSIQNIDELERVVKIGEGYMEAMLHRREEWMVTGMRIALIKDLKDELQQC